VVLKTLGGLLVLAGVIGYVISFALAAAYKWRNAASRSARLRSLLPPWRYLDTPYIGGLAISVLVAMAGLGLGALGGR
jgi:hypothetical protein